MSIKHLSHCLASTKCKIIDSCSYFKTTIITFYWLCQLEFNTTALTGKKKLAVPNKDRYEHLSHGKQHRADLQDIHGSSVVAFRRPRMLSLFYHLHNGFHSQDHFTVQGGFWSVSQHIWVLGLKEKRKDQENGPLEAESAPYLPEVPFSPSASTSFTGS